jgi:hypothetical protein
MRINRDERARPASLYALMTDKRKFAECPKLGRFSLHESNEICLG